MKNVQALPVFASTQIEPPWWTAKSLQRDSPRPLLSLSPFGEKPAPKTHQPTAGKLKYIAMEI